MKRTLVIVLAALGGLLGLVLLAIACCAGFRFMRWKAVRPEHAPPRAPAPPAGLPAKRGGGKARSAAQDEQQLRIRVQRPADADAALRQHRVGGALAELPWAPQTAV
jgi:hypothetical protein